MQLAKLDPISLWPIALFVFAFAGSDGSAAEKGFVEIRWVALPDQSKLKDPNAGRQLWLRVPREYVTQVLRDRSGEAARINGVDNGGIEIVRMKALLPGMDPLPSAKEQSRSGPSQVWVIGVDLRAAVYRGQGGAKVRELQLFSASKKRAYRLPDIYGFERYRPVGCEPGAPIADLRFDLPIETLPKGCRVPPGDDVLINVDDGTWVTCGYSGETMCVMRTSFEGFWRFDVIFPRSELERWRDIKASSAALIRKFSVN